MKEVKLSEIKSGNVFHVVSGAHDTLVTAAEDALLLESDGDKAWTCVVTTQDGTSARLFEEENKAVARYFLESNNEVCREADPHSTKGTP